MRLMSYKSDYRSDTLTAEKRAELAEACNNSKRTTFYDLTPEQVSERNEWTLENLEFGVVVLNWDAVVDRLGLELSEMQIQYKMDDDTDEPLIGEDGEPIVASRTWGPSDFKVNVTRDGLEDAKGQAIPKGPCHFRVTKQATNRPRNETNFKSLVDRMEKWAFNGEAFIKDANGVGASEQHRCIAKAIRILTGMDEPDDQSTISFFVDGIHPDIVVTIDTGKSNTGKDIFGSDPEIVPPESLIDVKSILHPDGEVKYVDDQVKERTKACGVTESATKLVLLRCGGKNVNASLGNSQAATEKAHIFATRVIPDIDDLAARCQVVLSKVPFKDRPCSPAHLTAALALHFMRDCEHIDTIPRNKVDGGTPIDEADPIRFDLDTLTHFFADLSVCNVDGPLYEWAGTQGRLSAAQKKEPNHVKFAQLALMLNTYFGDEGPTAISRELLTKASIGGKQDAKKYYHFGGADRGPIVKEKKD